MGPLGSARLGWWLHQDTWQKWTNAGYPPIACICFPHLLPSPAKPLPAPLSPPSPPAPSLPWLWGHPAPLCSLGLRIAAAPDGRCVWLGVPPSSPPNLPSFPDHRVAASCRQPAGWELCHFSGPPFPPGSPSSANPARLSISVSQPFVPQPEGFPGTQR